MAYDIDLADRIRYRLNDLPNVEEKAMMGGLAFMYNGKMCIGVMKNAMMCRIDPEKRDEALAKPGARIMDFTGKPMMGFVLVKPDGIERDEDFEYWIGLCLDFNPKAKASPKKRRDK